MRHFSLRYLIFLALLAFLANGCDSSNDEFVATGSDPGLAGPRVTLTGKVEPGVSAGGVPVTIVALDGAVLRQATSDASGNFQVEDLPTTPDFRVVATFASGAQLATEVRGYAGGGRYTVLNIPTTLASRLTQNGDAAILAQAEGRVKTFLGIPAPESLEYGMTDSGRAYFSHLAFFLEAAGQGGWPAYLDELQQRMQSAQARAFFRLRSSDLTASLAGVDAELAPLLEEFRQNDAVERSVKVEALRRVPDLASVVADGSESVHNPFDYEAPESVNGKIVESLLEQVGDLAFDQAVDVGWTHIADALNLNYGTTRMLEEIQESLNDVLNAVNGISIAVAEGNLQDAINDLASNQLPQLETYTQYLTQYDITTALPQPETPYTPTGDVQAILSDLATFSAETDLNAIQGFMLTPSGQTPDQSNILIGSRDFILEDTYGLGLDSTLAYFPVRSVDMLNQVFATYEYYAKYQGLAVNLIGETAHLDSNPVAAINSAQEVAYNTILSLRRQRAQYPSASPPPQTDNAQVESLGYTPFMPSNVLVDLQGGLMWYTQIQGDKSLSDAISYANNFSCSNGNGGNYTDWRLPTMEEMRLLQDRARLVNTGSGSYGDVDTTTDGLPFLGFTNTSYLNDNGDALALNYTLINTKSTPSQEYQLNYTGSFSPNSEFRLNEDFNEVSTTTNQRPFFLVRNVGKPVVPIEATGTVGVDQTDAPIPFTWTDVQAFEFPYFGQATTVTDMVFLIPAGADSTLPTQLGCNLTYSFTVGGNFSMGTSSASASRSYPTRQENSGSTSYPTYDGPASAFTRLNHRTDLVSFSTTNQDVTLSPNGRLYWHGSGFGGFDLTATANIRDVSGVDHPFTQTLFTPTSSVRELEQIQIFPRNKIYSATSPLVNVQDSYYAVGFYSDNTASDLTSQVVWAALDNSTNQPAAGVGFSPQEAGLLTITNSAPEFVKITATLGSSPGESDSTVIKVVTDSGVP